MADYFSLHIVDNILCHRPPEENEHVRDVCTSSIGSAYDSYNPSNCPTKPFDNLQWHFGGNDVGCFFVHLIRYAVKVPTQDGTVLTT